MIVVHMSKTFSRPDGGQEKPVIRLGVYLYVSEVIISYGWGTHQPLLLIYRPITVDRMPIAATAMVPPAAVAPVKTDTLVTLSTTKVVSAIDHHNANLLFIW